ncbi:hypothetical protein [Streptomyces sp. NBC_00448]|uniref:hypothetical protein n=1 Tax=Streptomyces sp. NBC_00448 TaxID=2903652 RepID=UPI002E1D10F7
MSKPEYVRDIVKDRLLTTSRNRFALWKALPEKYFSALSREMKVRGWSLLLQGYPDLASFSLLEESDPEGNSWFAKVLDRDRVPRWLLWYGFSSQRMLDISREGIRYPAIFTSIRDDNPASIHPYRPFQPGGAFPDEIVLRPMEKKPVLFRSGYDVDEFDLPIAARYMADALTE